MQSTIILIVLSVFTGLCIAAHGHHGGGGGGGHHHHGGGGGGGGHHHHHSGGGGFGGHHHHHYHSSGGSSYSGGGGYGGGGSGFGLLSLLFGRRNYYSYPGYGYSNYYYQQPTGYCRVSQFVDYVGRIPRYYCDCPPYPPNYQWNTCVPMATNYYGK